MNDELVPADPVYDGELVNEPARRRPFMNWWCDCRYVPTAFKSREFVTVLLRSPPAYLGAVGRGLLAALRAWRRWVRVHDYRAAAEQAEKPADRFTEIRELTRFRWEVSGAGMALLAALLTVVAVLAGAEGLWLAGGVASVVLAVGQRKEGAPGRRRCWPDHARWSGRGIRRCWSTPSATPG